MSELTVEFQTGQEEVFDFLNWKTPPKGEERISCYISRKEGPAVLTLRPPQPKGAVWSAPPFPLSAPQIIRRTRLIPPPVRGRQKEAECLVEFALSDRYRGCDSVAEMQAQFADFALKSGLTEVRLPEPWEFSWIASGGRILWPKPEHKALLADLLERRKAAWREEMERRLAEIEATTSEELGRSFFSPEDYRPFSPPERCKWQDDERRRIPDLFRGTRRRCVQGGHQIVSNFEATVEDIENGNFPDLLEEVLHKEWAELEGYDLEVLRREERAFEQWLRHRLMNRRCVSEKAGRIDYDLFLSSAELLKWKARVTCEVEFADASRVYLTGVEGPRAPMADEQSELEKLRPTLSWSIEYEISADGSFAGGVVTYKRGGDPPSHVPIGEAMARIIQTLDAAPNRVLSKQILEKQVKEKKRFLSEWRAERFLDSKEGKLLLDLGVLRVHSEAKRVAYSLAPHGYQLGRLGTHSCHNPAIILPMTAGRSCASIGGDDAADKERLEQ